MDFAAPPSFPMDDFRAFGMAASSLFAGLISDENLADPLEKRRNFDWAWQAVRYRYRTCVERADEFTGLLFAPSGIAWPDSAAWLSGAGDEELTYKLEQAIYVFFVGALSVFESFGFGLYFLGHAIKPGDFPHIATPKQIKLRGTGKTFVAAFPNASITGGLTELVQKPEFIRIEKIRNLLAHRLSGRPSFRSYAVGWTHTHVETWHIPDLADALQFSPDMLHDIMDEVTGMLTTLIAAARQFAESQESAGRSHDTLGSY
jgi:hypothetical protein